jgi:hypothetical protein
VEKGLDNDLIVVLNQLGAMAMPFRPGSNNSEQSLIQLERVILNNVLPKTLELLVPLLRSFQDGLDRDAALNNCWIIIKPVEDGAVSLRGFLYGEEIESTPPN